MMNEIPSKDDWICLYGYIKAMFQSDKDPWAQRMVGVTKGLADGSLVVSNTTVSTPIHCGGYQCDEPATTTVYRYSKISDSGGMVSASGGSIPVCEKCREIISIRTQRQRKEFGLG